MSTFKVSIEKVDKIIPIAGADKIEIAKLEGKDFQFVVGKNQFKVGDFGFYFPVDSIIPEDVLEKIGLTGKLAGSEKNRVKTIKLRGEISQGVFVTVESVFPGFLLIAGYSDFEEAKDDDFTEYFGVTKYEPEEVPSSEGVSISRLPDGLSKYDIESAQNYKEKFLTFSKYNPLFITEKIEGQNYCAGIDKDNNEFVCSRSRTIKKPEPDEDTNKWWKTAQKYDLHEKARNIKSFYGCKQVTIYGEQTGPSIQGNIYGLKEVSLFCFDIKIDGNFLSFVEWKELCDKFDIPMVPILQTDVRYKEEVDFVTLSHGKSLLNNNVSREGIVFKPMIEANIEHFGRAIFKVRDPIYLSKEK